MSAELWSRRRASSWSVVLAHDRDEPLLERAPATAKLVDLQAPPDQPTRQFRHDLLVRDPHPNPLLAAGNFRAELLQLRHDRLLQRSKPQLHLETAIGLPR